MRAPLFETQPDIERELREELRAARLDGLIAVVTAWLFGAALGAAIASVLWAFWLGR